MAALLMGTAASGQGDQTTFNNVRSILDNYRESLAFASWSVTSAKTKRKKVATDADILKKVEKLGDLYSGRE